VDTRTAVKGWDDASERVKQLEGVVRALLRDVVPHTRETGHNAADREMRAAIDAAHAAVHN
jgi:hypothetical protein